MMAFALVSASAIWASVGVVAVESAGSAATVMSDIWIRRGSVIRLFTSAFSSEVGTEMPSFFPSCSMTAPVTSESLVSETRLFCSSWAMTWSCCWTMVSRAPPLDDWSSAPVELSSEAMAASRVANWSAVKLTPPTTATSRRWLS